MGDTEILGGGIFISLWLISFFGYSAHQLRKGYELKEPLLGGRVDTKSVVVAASPVR